jgi:deoxycytidylate deaminase
MTVEHDACVIGFTGSFGSGCTTAAALLSSPANGLLPRVRPRLVRLSAVLKAEWKSRSKGTTATRHDLQSLGDELRATHGPDHLASISLAKVEDLKQAFDAVFVDGIRNTGEVRWLRKRFSHRFFLIAIDAPTDSRWERCRKEYEGRGESLGSFLDDDARDLDEETPWGQQVQLCVDEADVMVSNARKLSAAQLANHLGVKVRDYIELLSGRAPRYPTQNEVNMNMAYSASHSTRCLKRQVGAVIAFGKEIVSTGYNENPSTTKPCVEEYGECYRDAVRNEYFKDLAQRSASCPSCGSRISEIVGPPWRCAGCGTKLDTVFFPGRAMLWCTALHAEELAIINARGRDVRGATLYTTAFPCFLCAQKITNAGISEVIFMEPYPDIRAGERFELAGVTVQRFEGVRSSAFDRIFSRIRQLEEDRINETRRLAGLPKT